jgi:putative colanic acid biosynthesis acetyltransferase WcaF
MSASRTNLGAYNNSWYKPGRGLLTRALWYVVSLAVFRSAFPFYRPKRVLLRLFGAKIGRGLVIKPHVSIKYPWRLTTGDHVWIGEHAWIDNLGNVTLKSHSCISQGAMLLCGNHDYKKSTFDLVVEDITLEEGSWAGAKTVVCPGVTLGANSLLTVGSVATGSLEADWIYQGNPAQKVKLREIVS